MIGSGSSAAAAQQHRGLVLPAGEEAAGERIAPDLTFAPATIRDDLRRGVDELADGGADDQFDGPIRRRPNAGRKCRRFFLGVARHAVRCSLRGKRTGEGLRRGVAHQLSRRAGASGDDRYG